MNGFFQTSGICFVSVPAAKASEGDAGPDEWDETEPQKPRRCGSGCIFWFLYAEMGPALFQTVVKAFHASREHSKQNQK